MAKAILIQQLLMEMSVLVEKQSKFLVLKEIMFLLHQKLEILIMDMIKQLQLLIKHYPIFVWNIWSYT